MGSLGQEEDGRLLDLNKRSLWLEHRVRRTTVAGRLERPAGPYMNSHPNSQELTVRPSDYSPENEVFSLKFYTVMEFPSSISSPITFKVDISKQTRTHSVTQS